MDLLTTAAKGALGPRAPVLVLAHGAGAPMDSPFMSAMAGLLAERGMTVVRFEFDYMAGRRTGAKRRPPPPLTKLRARMRDVTTQIAASAAPGQKLLIGGKSMGGRVASLIADDLHAQGLVAGLVALGYPFHPRKKPDSLRTAHLLALRCPALIVQGEADPLGTRTEVATYGLSRSIELHWIAGADHDLVPKAGPERTKAQARDLAWADAADAVARFAVARFAVAPPDVAASVAAGCQPLNRRL